MKFLSGVLLASVLQLATVLLTSCATNPVADSYRDHSTAVDSTGAAAPLATYSGKTQLQASTNLVNDGANLSRDGYVMVGTFTYEGRDPVTAAQIIAQGEKVQADVVLYRSGTGFLREAVPIADDPEPTPAPQSSGATDRATQGHGAATVTTTHQGDSVPNRPGTISISTGMTPTVRLPVHEATFWRKCLVPSKS